MEKMSSGATYKDWIPGLLGSINLASKLFLHSAAVDLLFADFRTAIAFDQDASTWEVEREDNCFDVK